MRVTLWGTRGSLAAPGPETVGYGGNTACVEILAADGGTVILDAGTGLRRLGLTLVGGSRRIDILLSHLHVDHIQGLGFFGPLFEPGREIHIWGPPSTTMGMRARLARYLSPPLFPVPLRELPSRLTLHDVPLDTFELGCLKVDAGLICHPGSCVGYRIEEAGLVLTYLPDHEPALGARAFPGQTDWISGYELARDADLLIHDAQYTDEEYPGQGGLGPQLHHPGYPVRDGLQRPAPGWLPPRPRPLGRHARPPLRRHRQAGATIRLQARLGGRDLRLAARSAHQSDRGAWEWTLESGIWGKTQIPDSKVQLSASA